MLGKDTTVLCLHMAKQAQGNLTPWLAMDKIKVNVHVYNRSTILILHNYTTSRYNFVCSTMITLLNKIIIFS